MAVATPETTQESPYQPTYDLCTATVDELRKLNNPWLGDNRRLHLAQNALTHTLDVLHFETTGTFSSAHAMMEKIHADDLEHPLRSRVRRFTTDLGYLSSLELNGISYFNALLSLRVDGFHKKTITDINPNISLMNDILARVIYLFPYLARAVEVEFMHPDDRLDELSSIGQVDFNKLSRGVDLHGDRKLKRLVLPLPYVSPKDEFKTAEELPVEPKSQQTVWFKTQGDPEKPVLAVKIYGGTHEAGYSYFPIDQIEAVRFIQKAAFESDHYEERFTPCLEYNKGDVRVVARPNWISHYLRFREFGYSSAYRYRQTEPEYDRAEAYKRFLLFPKDGSNLFVQRTAMVLFEHLERGFIAIDAEDAAGTRMYEVSDVGLPEVSMQNSIPYLMTSIWRGNRRFLDRHVKRYAKEDIVKRLAAIPVHRS